ncbi:hypothetical protein ABFV83_03000 [Lacrimispora sp. BS-2]|uniref:Uncharacterized protein n=1 Tax=Lacrimispora sp. BS-2 TaxID=3151850 RepID=A0AAU7PRV4_9FIRM
MAPNDNIHFGKNAFEQWAESLLCDEYFINEDMQFTNYPGFHIAGVKAGWFDILLVDRAKTINITASNYLGHDAPFELLKAVNDLTIVNTDDKSKTNWISWDDEPGTYIWKLERQNETININIYESQTIPKDRKHLEKEETYRIDFETNGEFLGFVKEVSRCRVI